MNLISAELDALQKDFHQWFLTWIARVRKSEGLHSTQEALEWIASGASVKGQRIPVSTLASWANGRNTDPATSNLLPVFRFLTGF